jgi:hypothetical protein
MPDPTSITMDTRRPITAAVARGMGFKPSALRGKNFCTIFRGVYAHVQGRAHPLIRTRAALMIHPPTAFASHTSAARIHQVPLPALPDEHVSVFEAKDRRRRPGIRNHVAAPETPVVVVDGDRASSPEQMFVELAGIVNLVELVAVGDDLVRRKLTTPKRLRAHCAQSDHQDAAAARLAAAYVREGVDSPMETRLRMLLVLAGLPEPEVDFRIFWSDGRVRYRFDLSYPEFKVIVEYDGRQHRADLDQWDTDTERKDWFDHNGWMHVPVFSRGIYRRPDDTLRRVGDALRSRGCTTLIRDLSDDWRPFFPVRR